MEQLHHPILHLPFSILCNKRDMKRPSNRYRTHNDKRFYRHDSGKTMFLTKQLHNSFLEVLIKSLCLSFLTLSYPHTCYHELFSSVLDSCILLHFHNLCLFVIHLFKPLFSICVRLLTASYRYIYI